MLIAYLGHIAALMTSVAWSFTSIFFTLAGRQVGSVVVNRTRLLMAVVLVALVHWLTQGSLIPLDAEPFRWGWLALSGVVGLVLGDASLFQALVMVGPRLSMLMMSLAPVFSTLIAWVMLGERLSMLALSGIALAVIGVALVVSDREPPADPEAAPRRYMIGLLFALGGALGQAGGLVLSKQGLVGDFSALSGNLIRLIAAAGAMWLFTVFSGHAADNFRKLRDHPRALRSLIGGTIAGPFVGVWLSLVAVQRAPVGIAATLMSLAPVILLPVGRLMFDERFTWRAIVGTLVAFAGTVILFIPSPA